MIYYSVIPSEVIFQGMEDFHPHYEEIQLNGLTMQVEPIGSNQARIVRLISTNPQDYINPRYTPGTMIEYSPHF
ncbi:YlzJ-like family protein [Paenibacillus eucommiae]|uniref:Uncharacterized protein n=1 Tax=Paenibacillus eucommiae TaxID=1355755 RepID=A0ABS4IW94_9BACL|nr:YlzJ-like family protein [Paenibacillus eucommiae]MBP1991276.1 hypothetical protein [Paenibacillus eucommiae]